MAKIFTSPNLAKASSVKPNLAPTCSIHKSFLTMGQKCPTRWVENSRGRVSVHTYSRQTLFLFQRVSECHYSIVLFPETAKVGWSLPLGLCSGEGRSRVGRKERGGKRGQKWQERHLQWNPSNPDIGRTKKVSEFQCSCMQVVMLGKVETLHFQGCS